MKIRMSFEKNVRYISHLELMRTIQRILKRSGLPLKYSEGFNPHIILSIAVPIPVGVCGKKEFADFEIKEDLDPKFILKSLKDASDNAIKPTGLFFDCKKSFNSVMFASYEIDIISDEADRIIEFLNQNEINTEKKAKGKIKIINLKEYIHELDFIKTENGLKIKCLLSCGNEKNLNPMLIRKALLKENISLEAFNATRLSIYDSEMKEFLE